MEPATVKDFLDVDGNPVSVVRGITCYYFLVLVYEHFQGMDTVTPKKITFERVASIYFPGGQRLVLQDYDAFSEWMKS